VLKNTINVAEPHYWYAALAPQAESKKLWHCSRAVTLIMAPASAPEQYLTKNKNYTKTGAASYGFALLNNEILFTCQCSGSASLDRIRSFSQHGVKKFVF
jgi:hypothetical protein